jgi:hypothetical protein
VIRHQPAPREVEKIKLREGYGAWTKIEGHTGENANNGWRPELWRRRAAGIS